MAPSEDKICEMRIAHLQFVVSAIARMASYSASAKGYCLTIVTAILGLSIAAKSLLLLWTALLPTAMFYVLDARYLYLEREFRVLYDKVRLEDWSIMPDFDVRPPKGDRFAGYSFFSWSVFIFYVLIALLIVLMEFGGRYAHVSLH